MMEKVSQIAKLPEVKQSNSNPRVRRTEYLRSIDTPEDHILYLQRTAGNQAVSRLMKSGALSITNISTSTEIVARDIVQRRVLY